MLTPEHNSLPGVAPGAPRPVASTGGRIHPDEFPFLGPSLITIVLLAALLRLMGIGYGLPAVFNSDEPHHVNIAVSFGRGSLNPMLFKYPTLWMYTLFACYSMYFLTWSGFGFFHSAREFGQLFVWQPGSFYLLGRLVSAGFSLLALHCVYRTGVLLGSRRLGLWAAALLAVSPTANELAHSAKPNSMMFFLAAWAWYLALSYRLSGRDRDLLLCAAAVGLAISTQYVAAPLALSMAAAWWARRLERGSAPLSVGLSAVLVCTGAFLAGTPFMLLDWPAFWRDIRELAALNSAGSARGIAPFVNALNFAGHWAACGTALAWGALKLMRRKPTLALVLLAPALADIAVLALSPEGDLRRHLMVVYPALALVAAFGVEAAVEFFGLGRAHGAWCLGLLAALMLPGLWESFAFDRQILLPDTRTLSADWIKAHIPPGTRILADKEHASPRLVLSRSQIERLLEQTRATGHPRQRYFELMLESHPGGGYEVYQVRREAAEMRTGSWHLAWSSQGRLELGIQEGLKEARRASIQVVVLTSFGLHPEKSAAWADFVREVERQGKLLAEFNPEPGHAAGPQIRIYRIAP